jgi:hypothetical protein
VQIRRAVVPLVLLLAAALASCGGDGSGGSDDSDGGAAAPPDGTSNSSEAGAGDGGAVEPCDLLSTDDVAAAVGTPVKEGVASSGPAVTGGSFDTCVWQSDDTDQYGMATVTIYPNGDAADSARGEGAETVEGVGSQAFSVQFSGLWVYVDDRSFFAQWYTLDDVDLDNLPQSTALAEAVISAL